MLIEDQKSNLIPLTPQQREIYIDHINKGETPAYNIGGYVDIKELVNIAKMEQAIQLSLRQNKILNCRFPLGLKNIFQVEQLSEFNLEMIDYSSLTEPQRVAKSRVQEIFQKPFRLDTESLFRIGLIKISEQHYWLYFISHHIVIDGWGYANWIRQIFSIYAKLCREESLDFEPLPCFLEIARSGELVTSPDKIEKSKEFWQEIFSDTKGSMLQQQSGGDSFSTKLIKFITPEQYQTFLSKANENKLAVLPLFMTALSLLCCSIARGSGITLGTPLHNRATKKQRAVVGVFMSMLPVRIEYQAADTVADAVARVTRDLQRSFRHKNYPVSRIFSDALTHNKQLSKLFEAAFNYQQIDFDFREQGINAETCYLNHEQETLPLIATLCEYGEQQSTQLQLDFRHDYFNEYQAQNLLESLWWLVNQMVEAPQSRLDQLTLISDYLPLPDTKSNVESVLTLFAHQVNRVPEHTAIEFDGHTVSYQQLDQLSDALAIVLQQQGCRKGSLVAICLPRSIEMVAYILATLKVGAAYVPIDYEYPKDKIHAMLQDIAPQLLVILEDEKSQLTDLADKVLSASDFSLQALLGQAPVTKFQRAESAPDDLAYIMFTSGSTGRPKGTMIEHRSLSHFVTNIKGTYQLTSDDRILQFSTFSFDIFVEECFGALCHGCTLVLRSPEITSDADAFWRFIEDKYISVMSLPTAFWHQLVASSAILLPESLRLVILGGEALKAELVKRWFNLESAPVLVNTYGPTETTVTATTYLIRNNDDVVSPLPIGKANPQTELYILDADKRRVPRGCVGELYIGGISLARGYYQNQQDTVKAFSDNPFAPGRLYKTGDLVCEQPDGNLQFLGRIDNQLKIRGFRVEPDEVAEHLMQCGAKEAVVTSFQSDLKGKQLVAYVTGIANTQQLRQRMKQRVPAYMVPAAIIALDSLPLTSNGKTDFRRLPEPGITAQEQGLYVAPGTPEETVLVEVWQRLLSVSQVGVHDNFFESGGFSLLVIDMMSQLRDQGYQMQVADLYRSEVLKDFALTLKRLDHKVVNTVVTEDRFSVSADCRQTISQRISGSEQNIQRLLPLSPLQEGIFFHHRLNQTNDPYVIPVLLEFADSNDISSFFDALQVTINRHEALRTAIVWKNLDSPVQVVCRQASINPVVRTFDSHEQAREFCQAQLKGQRFICLEEAPLIECIQVYVAGQQRGYVIFKQHHLISDHVSILLQIQEITRHMAGEVADAANPYQYRDFVDHCLNVADLQGAKEYFASLLKDVTETVAPFRMLDVHGDGSDIEILRQRINPAFSQQIKDIASKYNCSPAVLFHMTWALLVAKTARTNKVVFGTLMSGRLQPVKGIGSMLGLLINQLPFVLSISDESVAAILKKVDVALAELVNYEFFPLSAAQALSDIPAGRPLFTSILNYRHKGEQHFVDGGNRFKLKEVIEYTNYPLEIGVDVEDKFFELEVHSHKLIGARLVLELFEQTLYNLVHTLQHAPGSKFLSIDILSESRKQQAVALSTGKSVLYPGTQLVHRRFEQMVNKYADNIAAVCGDQSISYRELNSRANRLARYLIENGLSQGNLVAIHLPRSIDFLCAILATLKAGCAYVPVDNNCPDERLTFILQHSSAQFVLVDDRFNTELTAPLAINVITSENVYTGLADFPEHNLDVQQEAGSAAYMIYTSGSTGKPKGALVHHAGALNHIDAEFDVLGYLTPDLSATSRNFLQSAAVSSDVSVWQFLAPVLSGGKTVILQEVTDLKAYLHTLQHEDVNLIQTAPSVLGLLIEYLQTLSPQERQLPALQWLMIIAEPCPVRLVNQWLEMYPRIPVMNGYGPSEASDDITWYIIDKALDENWKTVPVGNALPNLSMYVVDDNLCLMPPNVVGELCVSGVGVGLGYWQNPAKTEAAFKANPFIKYGGHGKRLYRTGDLGRMLPCGTIELLGRTDNQIKIRGFRVELGEIEAAFTALDVVKDAVVLLRTDNIGNKFLAAWLVLHHQTDASSKFVVGEILQELRQQLPDHMIPAHVELLDAMPLNAADKIDRKALLEIKLNRQVLDDFEAPESVQERQLAVIWSELLGPELISRNDNFFQLGGNSLSLMKLAARVNKVFKVELPVKSMFDATNLAELALLVQQAPAARIERSENRIPENCRLIHPEMLDLMQLNDAELATLVMQVHGRDQNIQDIYPLMPLQKGMLYQSLLDGTSDTYIEQTLLTFGSHGRFQEFLAAFNRLLMQYDVLRTVFIWEGLKEPAQVVLRNAELKVTQLKASSSETSLQLMQDLLASGATAMDLATAPLIEVVYCTDGTGCNALVRTHHLLLDHVSTEILFSELAQQLAGKQPAIPTAGKFREQVAAYLRTHDNSSAMAFYQEKLGQIQTPTLVFEGFNDAAAPIRQTEHSDMLDTQVVAQIRQVCRQLKITPATLFHAAWAVVLAKCTRQQQVTFATVLLGRMQATDFSENVLGMLINTLPVHLILEQASTLELVQQTHQYLSDMMTWEHASLSEVLRLTNIPAGTKLFNSLLNYRNIEVQAIQTGGAELADGIRLLKKLDNSEYDVDVNVSDLGGDFQLHIASATFMPARVLVGLLQNTINDLVNTLQNESGKSWKSLSILTEQDVTQQLQAYQYPQRQWCIETTLHQRFEAMVLSFPDEVAVVHGQQELTYQQLNLRANQLADYLRANGVAEGQRVGIYMPRCCDFLVSILAIMKASAAYVPFDPVNPKGRLETMLADAQLSVLITHQALDGTIVTTDVPCVLQYSASELQDYNGENVPHKLAATRPAYMLYTSGSTGKPKGALVHHAGAMNHIFAEFHVLGFIDDQGQPQAKNFLQTAASSSDVSVWQFLAPLMCGGKTVIIDDTSDIKAVFNALYEHHIHLIEAAPVVIGLMLDYVQSDQINTESLYLQWLMTTGEATTSALIKRWFECFPQIPVVNGYGPTEASDDITYHIQRDALAEGYETLPIGIALPNLAVYVMDEQQQLLPLGVPGEICVAGIGVGLGYWKNEEKTRQSFVNNPYADGNIQGEVLYRTGDLGRWETDNEGQIKQLHFIGRFDDQVKIRGFRIELGEVESALAKIQGVGSAAVIVVDDHQGQKALAAYLVGLPGSNLQVKEVRSTLCDMLPPHMIPANFTVLQSMPMNAANKIDRRALPVPDFSVFDEPLSKPESAMQITIARSWSKLFGIDQAGLGLESNFFELGGHSILVVQLLSELRSQLALQLTVSEVFVNPTIGQLSELLEEKLTYVQLNEKQRTTEILSEGVL